MKFKVGDVCYLVCTPGCAHCLPYQGMECTISHVGLPSFPVLVDCCTGVRLTVIGYQVDCANGKLHWVEERNLRLKRPPSWDKFIGANDLIEGEVPLEVERIRDIGERFRELAAAGVGDR